MKILFDQGVPYPLKKLIENHDISTAYDCGWSSLQNGELITRAEKNFEIFITTDKNLRYQQNLKNRKVAIIVLPTTSWKIIQQNIQEISNAIDKVSDNNFIELEF